MDGVAPRALSLALDRLPKDPPRSFLSESIAHANAGVSQLPDWGTRSAGRISSAPTEREQEEWAMRESIEMARSMPLPGQHRKTPDQMSQSAPVRMMSPRPSPRDEGWTLASPLKWVFGQVSTAMHEITTGTPVRHP